jgi:hypothetical protein
MQSPEGSAALLGTARISSAIATMPSARSTRSSAPRFPSFVTSGGPHPVFEAICDVIEQDLKAERAIIRGAGHNVPRTGAPFNARLETFLA